MKISEIIEQKQRLEFDGNFGLEKESLRVDEKGFLAHTSHPFLENKNIDRDFCENQIEIITDVCKSIEDVYEQIKSLHNLVVSSLYNLKTGKEYIWQFSNPPYVKSEEDIPVAEFDGNLKGKEIYREYLAKKYGKRKMLYSGIHFNFSFTDKYIEELFCKSNEKSIKKFKDKLYLTLAKLVTKYSWLIIYLTAASPVMDKSFFNDENCQGDYLSKYSSPRCGKNGYWNDFVPILKYDDIKSYVKSIQNYIDVGQLKSPAELYYPVRLKSAGENSLENLELSGVNHIELRMFDLNPLSQVGIMIEDLQFVHCFLIFLLNTKNTEWNDFEQMQAIKNAKNAALFDDEDIWIETDWYERKNIKNAALEILVEMEKYFGNESLSYAQSSIQFQKRKILEKGQRYADRIKEKFSENNVEKGLELARGYARQILEY